MYNAPNELKMIAEQLCKMFSNIDIPHEKIRIISIWKVGFSDFRNYSFSVLDFSFVYAYTKEKSKTLKE